MKKPDRIRAQRIATAAKASGRILFHGGLSPAREAISTSQVRAAQVQEPGRNLLATAGELPEEPKRIRVLTEDAPHWTWSWFRWQSGEGWTFFWICLIHALAFVGLIFAPFPGWGVIAATYAVLFIGGLGTTVGYHRALAHRAVRLNPIVEFLLIGAAMMNGSGSPATWCANHRFHHARADTPDDISSPRRGGFWWAHLRWLWQAAQSPIPKWAPDLDRPCYRGWTRFQIPIHAIALCIGLPFGWAAFFWLGAIRLTFALHAQCFVNSLAHMKKGATLAEDSSDNIAWLAPVQALQGENWHSNHHARPSSARFGWTWKQIDLGWCFIVILAKLRLATHVRVAVARPDMERTLDETSIEGMLPVRAAHGPSARVGGVMQRSSVLSSVRSRFEVSSE